MQLQNSSNLSNKKSNSYKYFLFYSKKNGELYAYTDKEILAKGFNATREHNMFVATDKMLTSSELKEIYDMAPDTLLEPYKFKMGKNDIVLPITLREKLQLEHTITQTLEVSIYMSARIDPNLFTEKIQHSLQVLKYVDIYKEYHSGEYSITNLTPDPITCFLSLFGDTMRKRW